MPALVCGILLGTHLRHSKDYYSLTCIPSSFVKLLKNSIWLKIDQGFH